MVQGQCVCRICVCAESTYVQGPCVCRVCVCAGVGLVPLKGLPSPARPLPFVLAQELEHHSP